MEPDWLDSSELKVIPKNKGKCIHGRDKYVDEYGKTILPCWRLNKQGIICITKKEEWNDRIKCLLEQIKYWIDNPSDKLVEQVQLFY